jgi:hypothetical protein
LNGKPILTCGHLQGTQRAISRSSQDRLAILEKKETKKRPFKELNTTSFLGGTVSMEASAVLWDYWTQQVKELFPEVNEHGKPATARAY